VFNECVLIRTFLANLGDLMENETLPDDLLAILACPVCKGDLDYKKKQNQLFCAKCNVNYPIQDGIPILLPVSTDK